MALAQRKESLYSPWPDNLIVVGIGAICRRQTRSSEDSFHSRRSLPGRETGLAFLGYIETPVHSRE